MRILFLIVLLQLFAFCGFGQNVGIGTNAPNVSAALDITDSARGLLIPRMTKEQRLSIANPAEGLYVYQTDDNKGFWYFDGSAWVSLMKIPQGGTEGQILTICNGKFTWTNNGECTSTGTNHHTCGATNVHNSTLSYGVVSDIDGNQYKTIKIGIQVWMAENLKTTRYSNGELIPNVINNTQWANLTSGAYCFNNNDNANDCPYGKLYNWYAATDSRNVCPSGWRVPSDVDWDILNTSIGDEGGNKLKTTGNQYWDLQNNGATNSTGFSGLPGGFREANSVTPVGSLGLWWTSEKIDGVGVETGIARYLASDGSILDFTELYKIDGLSIRCMRN